MPHTLLDQIDACLPQTQCTRCSYPRCRDYATAIERGEADINQCPPGGNVTIYALAKLLATPAKPLNPAYGERPPRTRAIIDENLCIGCRKCLDVCPVDAIIGAPKLMHTVIAADCTGCGLCLPPCPMDCIRLEPVEAQPDYDSLWTDYRNDETHKWRDKTERRLQRLSQQEFPVVAAAGGTGKNNEPAAQEKQNEPTETDSPPKPEQMRAEIAAAIARVRHRRGLIPPPPPPAKP